MSDYIKTGIVQSPHLLREVEPIAPYARINPHQPKRENYPGAQGDAENGQDEKSRRRFTSMRDLVARLQESHNITRLDYAAAEAEMHDQGLAVAEEQLIDLLLHLKIPLDSIDELLQQIRQQLSYISLTSGRRFNESSYPLFPVELTGLSEYCLTFANLLIPNNQHAREISVGIESHGRFVSEDDRLCLTFHQLALDEALLQKNDQLQLDIQVLVGAIEVDAAGRRAILFPRKGASTSFGLYADKQISLSI